MASVEDEFKSWHSSYLQSQPSVRLLRVEDGVAVLGFFRSEEQLAAVALAPVEGASFFAEGLDDTSEEVEDWLTDVNSLLADKSRCSLAEALTNLVSRAPKSFRLNGTSEKDDQQLNSTEDIEDEHEDDDAAIFAEVEEVTAVREAKRKAQMEDQHWDSVVSSSASQGSRQAAQVLMREMRSLMALQGSEGESSKALEIEMVDDSLYHWSVKMHADGFPADCSLRAELNRFATQHSSKLAAVVMDVIFPNNYPMYPPFIRVVRPRFQIYTGHITVGGSICMQLLTPSGWLPSVSLENVFVSIRSELVEGGGRLDFANVSRDYSLAESQEAFKRVASRYGWLTA
jgi:hypothetical protein